QQYRSGSNPPALFYMNTLKGDRVGSASRKRIVGSHHTGGYKYIIIQSGKGRQINIGFQFDPIADDDVIFQCDPSSHHSIFSDGHMLPDGGEIGDKTAPADRRTAIQDAVAPYPHLFFQFDRIGYRLLHRLFPYDRMISDFHLIANLNPIVDDHMGT